MRQPSRRAFPRHVALALLVSACGGTTLEETLGADDTTAGAAGVPGSGSTGGSGSGGGVSGSGGVGGAAAVGGSGGQGADGGAGGSTPGAGGTASGDGGTTAGTGAGGECAPSDDPIDVYAPPLDGGIPENLISDPSFESGHSGWSGQGSPTLSDVSERPRSGLKCLRATNRSALWMGPLLPLGGLVTGGSSYEVDAWVRVSVEHQPVDVVLKTVCQGEAATFTYVATGMASVCDWSQLSGQFEAPSCTLTSLDLVIEGASSGVDIFVDDVALVAVD